MATFSLCMIVKNEEKLLGRCLDSMADLFEEIIIVDTGSTDSTKEVARRYTSKIYDFQWINDFSAARNYCFSLASMDYIYSADADEYLDKENHHQLALLKDNILPEIEIVQMMYDTISANTVLNVKKEYRPKLFKRLRTFTWIDPIHESVRIDPVVFDSDVVITHAPDSNHAGRDFSIYADAIQRDGGLSDHLFEMLLVELYKCGNKADFLAFNNYILEVSKDLGRGILMDKIMACRCRECRLCGDGNGLLDLALFEPKFMEYSEFLLELGLFYMAEGNLQKAVEYLNKAAFEGTAILDIHSSGDLALVNLIECYELLMAKDEAYAVTFKEALKNAKEALANWQEPEEKPVE